MTTAHQPSLRLRLRQRGLDGVTLLVLPCVLFVLALFVYPFLYGLFLSFRPKEGGALANYVTFFSDPYLYGTIGKTLLIADPGHPAERHPVDPGGDARPADAASEASYDHPGHSDHARYRADRRGTSDLSRALAAGLIVS